jgi:hypothetical protein
MNFRKIAISLAACLWASLAFGQANNSSNWQTPGNQVVPGAVHMCINTAGQAVACSGAAPLPVSQNDRNVTCNLLLVNDTCVLNTQGVSSVGWYTTGGPATWTIVSELLYDVLGSSTQTWFTAQTFDSSVTRNILIPNSASAINAGQFSQGLNNDPWITNVGGAQAYRLRLVATAGGTPITVVLNGGTGVNAAAAYQTNPNNLQVTASPPGSATGQVTGTATGTTAGATATLTASATTGQFTYLCGYRVSPGSATAAITITITTTGLTNNLTDTVGAPVTAAGTTGAIVPATFTPCLKGTPANTNITVVAGALGTGGVNQAVNAWGYTQ